MTLNKVLLSIGFLLVFGFTIIKEDHAIYISVVKIKHEEAQPFATISMRVFTDDLKNSLRNKFGYEAISEKPTFCEDYEGQINQYFKKEFICLINREPAKYQLTKCEKLAEVYQLEFKMDCPRDWDSAKIEAPYFMELFPNQSNIFHIEDGINKRFGRTTKGNEQLRFRF